MLYTAMDIMSTENVYTLAPEVVAEMTARMAAETAEARRTGLYRRETAAPENHPPSGMENAPRSRQRTFIFKDLRFFLNSLERCLDLLRESGLEVKSSRLDTEEAILFTIRIPKGRGMRPRRG